MRRSSRFAGLIACGVWVLTLFGPGIRGQNVAIPALGEDHEERVSNPPGVFTISGSTLYGLSAGGGVKNRGAIFAIPVEGGAPRILASFDGSNGAQPWGNLTLGGSNLYGLTSIGGAHNKGTVFRFPVGGPKLTTLASFDGSNGANPWGGLTLGPDGSTPQGKHCPRRKANQSRTRRSPALRSSRCDNVPRGRGRGCTSRGNARRPETRKGTAL